MSTKPTTSDPTAAEAIRLAQQDAAKHRPPTPSNEREQLRQSLALEGLVLQPDGSVRGKSDKEG